MATLLELFMLYGIVMLFNFIHDFVLQYNPPKVIIGTIDYVKSGLVLIEGLFILLSLSMSIVMVLIVLLRHIKAVNLGAWNQLRKFLLESSSSVLFMGTMFGLAAFIGNFPANDTTGLLIMDYMFRFAFFLTIVGFSAVILASTHNSLRSRTSLLLHAWHNKGDDNEF